MTSVQESSQQPFLQNLRVLEIGNELGEYCGRLLAGLGADVIRIEPISGEVTRTYGPFYRNEQHIDRSLYFWHFNFGKRGIAVDLDEGSGVRAFIELATHADVVLESRPHRYMVDRGIGYDALHALNPALVYARISPFGDDGPWADFKGSDLVHLALGGVLMNCGYDPEPSGHYETPPIAPQMWQSYQISGEMTAIAVIGALLYRRLTGKGQYLSTAVHDAVSKQTELDLPNWIYLRQNHSRRTCRHSSPNVESISSTISLTKDGRWLLPYRTYLSTTGDDQSFPNTVALLGKYGMAADLDRDQYKDPGYLAQTEVAIHIGAIIDRFVSRFMFSRDIWREAQAYGLTWAPLRTPEENLFDEHWRTRETFIRVDHPELDKSFDYIGAKWVAPDAAWRKGPRAPLLGEHNHQVLGETKHQQAIPALISDEPSGQVISKRRKPFALQGARMIDLSWMLASGGAARYLTSLGAEVIRVEHKSRLDGMRWRNGIAPDGGRSERDRATGPIETPRPGSPNRGGYFMEINAGRRSISLNLRKPEGRELLTKLIATGDIVAEGFSPGTMERMGFGYERLKEMNRRIIYVQQSGMGQIGTYGRFRSYGPTAQALSGLSEMSGLPEPYPPAGIGYSYLDWFGAYSMALAIIAALYRQRVTGLGCWIDSSQVEAGIYLTGTAVLDFSVNGSRWSRYGNRSPYKAAAPHGVYRTKGADRWIAISCFTQEEWQGLIDTLGSPAWGSDARFLTLESRIGHQDDLDMLVDREAQGWEAYALMLALQAAGVPAGVCQTAQDRCENDPQLRHLEWMVELRQTEIGTWPVREFPVKFSETPAYMGGIVDRHGPNYAEDNEYVFGEVLGLSRQQMQDLAEQDVI